MLSTTELACVRGDRRLFSGLGFKLESGERLHVGGENGAGKTSLLRMLCGLSPPDAGVIRWQDEPIGALGDEYRKAVLYLGHHNALKEELTALENLQTSAALAGVCVTDDEAMQILRHVGLAGREELPVRYLSQGQKRRVALARLLWSRAPLWVLDEPFVALDVVAVSWLAQIVGAHVAGGGMAVLTSHQDVDIPGGVAQTLRIGA
ncbi:MAG: cytochrome c biogenesis heme-transporting ATPase CcmA [Nevskiales bacterium]